MAPADGLTLAKAPRLLRANQPHLIVMKSLRLLLLLLCVLGAITTSVRAQAPARYKRIVISLISRPLDKQYPAVLSDASFRVNGIVLATDATPSEGGYADHSIGRSLKFGTTYELFVYH